MAKNSVIEKEICAECGAEVRPQALFCYNCGARVASETETETNGKAEVSEAWFQDNLNKDAKTNKLNEVDLPIAKPDEPIEKPSDEFPAAPPKKRTEPAKEFEKLKTAASLKQKNRVKTFQKKKVEVIWEEPAQAPNIWFIISAVVIAILSAVALWLMLWIR